MPSLGAAHDLVTLALLLAAFYAMARLGMSQALTMSLVACILLVLQGDRSGEVLLGAAEHFAPIAAIFTSIAIPAHMIDRSGGFALVSAGLGDRVGFLLVRYRRWATAILVASLLALTFVTASILHNVTAILIMTPIIIRICARFSIPSGTLLSGALIASNLGGFSTAWGDTPNIVEARAWNLTHGDFFTEIFPVNVVVLVALVATVTALMIRKCAGTEPQDSLEIAEGVAAFREQRRQIEVDRWLLGVGLIILVCTIVGQAVFPRLAVAVSAAGIALAVLLERRTERESTLKSLSFDVYLVFASVFVIAGCIGAGGIGHGLRELVTHTDAAPWSVSLTAYLGTALTEAASWATAASVHIAPIDGSHTAAWALGAGICAGSSVFLTAASAGVVLAEESRRTGLAAHEMTFGRYLNFGLPFSLAMLAFYVTLFTFFGG